MPLVQQMVGIVENVWILVRKFTYNDIDQLKTKTFYLKKM